MHDQARGVSAENAPLDAAVLRIFQLETDAESPSGTSHAFREVAEVIIEQQRARSSLYGRYCNAIGSTGEQHYPYLPIDAFKQAPVTTFPPAEAQRVFESSGTGAGRPSRHYVKDLALYERSIEANFRRVFGGGPFAIATHLPHYAEMGARSSLLYMVEHLIDRFGTPGSGSFLHNPQRLDELVALSRSERIPLIVFGAAFGLLEFVERRPRPLPNDALVIETGGMKTYRRQISRRVLHERLAEGFQLHPAQIQSEYGMCEMLSQCYARGGEIYFPPAWVSFQILDAQNPFREVEEGREGILAVVDLANMHTVSPILTEDRAVRHGNGFAVIGRLSGTDLRGCNFLLEHV